MQTNIDQPDSDKETNYYLVKFYDNWADEMYIEGFDIITKEEKKQFDKAINEDLVFPVEVYFGTNEENTYESAEDVLNCYTFTPLLDEEAETIKKFFGNAYGGGYTLENWLDMVHDQQLEFNEKEINEVP